MTEKIDYDAKAKAMASAYHPKGNSGRKDPAVFDRWAQAPGYETRGQHTIEFRRTDADRAAPKKSMTRKLLGDPMPGRTPWAAE